MNSKNDVELVDDNAAAVPPFVTRKTNDAEIDLEVGPPVGDNYKP
eukprot:CAMPEP_0184696770 /NCGR_PEP_ID=MMETSP0313-20130426/3963_1 /TAXON_ID=2792 /ORGANISM="Porphyridium aerugineum, Strain SAG 1380-2" /LENGTH=44 /DNA_ID= /DNA_START= /DNA_END= /DNA_ORIENTATION=